MMQPTEKITVNQFGIILFSFVASTIVLTLPGLMAMYAKQDAWISVFPSTLTGFLSIWVMVLLSKRYPGLTIIQYSQKILGKWLGTCLGLYYIYFWFMSLSVMTIQHTYFIKALLLPRSPSIIGSLTLLILCGLAVYMGIEVIARCTEFLTPMKLIFLMPLLILTIGAADSEQLKPILGDGILPVLQGAFLPGGAFMNQLFILGWLLPYLNQPKKAYKVSLLALLGIFIFVFIVVISAIMILGSLTGQLNYSYLSVMQYIGIEGSFERLEAIAVMIWVIGSFSKVSVSLFILCISISQIFRIQNYRDLVAPITLLSLIGSAWVFKNGAELQTYLTLIYPGAGLVTQSLIPLLLLMIDSLRGKVNRSLH